MQAIRVLQELFPSLKLQDERGNIRVFFNRAAILRFLRIATGEIKPEYRIGIPGHNALAEVDRNSGAIVIHPAAFMDRWGAVFGLKPLLDCLTLKGRLALLEEFFHIAHRKTGTLTEEVGLRTVSPK